MKKKNTSIQTAQSSSGFGLDKCYWEQNFLLSCILSCQNRQNQVCIGVGKSYFTINLCRAVFHLNMPIIFIQVAEEEGGVPIELPTEENETLLLSTVAAQFPGASGLKYKATPETKTFRGVRLTEGTLHPPPDGGWNSKVFLCVFPKENKRKSDDTADSSAAKSKRLETKIGCTDLIVLGLAWKTTETELKSYFEKFGELLVSQVKKDREGNSKGYGFIRFAQYESQMRVLGQRHMIDGRWCDVKIPSSKEGIIQQLPCRLFVGRCTEDLSIEDLKNYFGKFGEVTDVFMPKPFRAFCFVTFLDPEVAQSICGEDHIIKGVSVHVSNAAPKSDTKRSRDFYSERGGGGDNYRGSNWRGGHSMEEKYNSHNRGYWNNRDSARGSNMDVSNYRPLVNRAEWNSEGNQEPSYNNGFNNRNELYSRRQNGSSGSGYNSQWDSKNQNREN